MLAAAALTASFAGAASAQPKGQPAAGPAVKVTVGVGAPGAGAKPPAPMTEAQKKERAKKAFQEGSKKFDAGDFTGAYELFKEANDLVPGAVPQFKMAESLDKQGDVVGAVNAYQVFIDSKPPADKHKARLDQAKVRVDALRASPADVKLVLTPATATFTIDGVAQTGTVVKVKPGKHKVVAKADNFVETSLDIDVSFGDKREVALVLQAKPTTTVVETHTTGPGVEVTGPKAAVVVDTKVEVHKGGSKVPAIITLSLAGAGAVVGGIFGGLALSSKSSFNKTPTQDLYDTTERDALISDMSFGVAITFGVTGIVLLATSGHVDEKKVEKASNTFIAPWGGKTGGGLVAGGRF